MLYNQMHVLIDEKLIKNKVNEVREQIRKYKARQTWKENKKKYGKGRRRKSKKTLVVKVNAET